MVVVFQEGDSMCTRLIEAIRNDWNTISPTYIIIVLFIIILFSLISIKVTSILGAKNL